MCSPDPRYPRRAQADFPLIALCRFFRPPQEAAVWLPPDTAAWREAGQCVEALFDNGVPISLAMLREAELLWAERRRVRSWPRAGQRISLATALRENPARLGERGLWLLIEHPAEADPATSDEKEVARNLGVDLNALDRWDGHVPLGMQAIAFDRNLDRHGRSTYNGTYVSETPKRAAAHMMRNGSEITVAEVTAPQELELKLQITFLTKADGDLLRPIFDALWRRRNEDWNFYRNRDWESVLVSVDTLIPMLPALG